MRPVKIDPIFNNAADVLTCFFGGIISPQLCRDQLKSKLETFPFLVTFNAPSADAEETHLSKENYFKIVESPDRIKDLVNFICGMVVVLAWEQLKRESIFFGKDGKLSSEFQDKPALCVLECLRNAAAHGNHFVFKFRWAKYFKKEKKQLKWRGLTLEEGWENKPAFPDFFPAGYFAYLFEDISNLAKSTEGQISTDETM